MIEPNGIVMTMQEIHDSEDDCWKINISYFTDGTKLTYYEKEDKTNKWIEKDNFWITAGFDITLFKTAYEHLANWKDREY